MQRKRILKRDEVQALTGLSKSAIYKQVSIGRFPKPVTLTADFRFGLLSAGSNWKCSIGLMRG